MNNEKSDTGALPLLASYSVTREGDPRLPGRYDSDKSVWVIDNQEGTIPIICSEKIPAGLLTKTEVLQEQDDPGIDFPAALLQLVTKTRVQQESDD